MTTNRQHKATEAELRALAESHGAINADTVLDLLGEAVRARKTSDPYSFIAWLKTDRPELFGDPTMARLLKGVPELPSSFVPGMTPMAMATPAGRFSDWAALNTGTLRARGLAVMSGTAEHARVCCMACNGELPPVPLDKPLSAQQLLCPAGCNRASGLSW